MRVINKSGLHTFSRSTACPTSPTARTVYPSWSNVSSRTERTTGSATNNRIVVFIKEWCATSIPFASYIPEFRRFYRRVQEPCSQTLEWLPRIAPQSRCIRNVARQLAMGMITVNLGSGRQTPTRSTSPLGPAPLDVPLAPYVARNFWRGRSRRRDLRILAPCLPHWHKRNSGTRGHDSHFRFTRDTGLQGCSYFADLG